MKSAIQTWRDVRRNKRDGCEGQVCHRVTCEANERKECIHRGKERLKEQYSPVNTDLWIRDLGME